MTMGYYGSLRDHSLTFLDARNCLLVVIIHHERAPTSTVLVTTMGICNLMEAALSISVSSHDYGVLRFVV